MATIPRATADDLMRFDGRAELIGGEVMPLMGTGKLPHDIANRIWQTLDAWVQATGHGYASGDGLNYVVEELPSGRESFGPDAAYTSIDVPDDLEGFVPGAPTFAVEGRSQNDYGLAAERDMAMKRADYFQAGTLAVWDVDYRAERITLYRSDAPESGIEFAIGELAHAEPAIPDWSMAVESVFRRRIGG